MKANQVHERVALFEKFADMSSTVSMESFHSNSSSHHLDHQTVRTSKQEEVAARTTPILKDNKKKWKRNNSSISIKSLRVANDTAPSRKPSCTNGIDASSFTTTDNNSCSWIMSPSGHSYCSSISNQNDSPRVSRMLATWYGDDEDTACGPVQAQPIQLPDVDQVSAPPLHSSSTSTRAERMWASWYGEDDEEELSE